jgi:hypothetical protein
MISTSSSRMEAWVRCCGMSPVHLKKRGYQPLTKLLTSAWSDGMSAQTTSVYRMRRLFRMRSLTHHVMIDDGQHGLQATMAFVRHLEDLDVVLKPWSAARIVPVHNEDSVIFAFASDTDAVLARMFL